MKIRRHDQLLCRWLPHGLEVALPGRKGWLALSEDLRQLLDLVGHGTETGSLLSTFDRDAREQVEAAVEKLLSLGVLVPYDAPPTLATVWRRWGQVTQRFHAESRDAYFPMGSPQNEGLIEAVIADGAAPPEYKEYDGLPTVRLSRDLIPLTMPIDEAFAARRTRRRFADAPLTIRQLGTLLFHSFAPYRTIDAGPFGTVQSRASAAAGARHEVEAYVVVFNVADLDPGLYHYGPRQHVLQLMNDDMPRDRIAEVAYRQGPSYEAPITIFTTAVVDRLSWKYRHPRAYRLWMYDAGHYGQTFALTATALGLGAFQTVMFNDTEVERLLDIDPDEEFAVYLLAAGVPGDIDGARPHRAASPGEVDLVTGVAP
jgi:SagB-type dehydrogenase family enzyme